MTAELTVTDHTRYEACIEPPGFCRPCDALDVRWHELIRMKASSGRLSQLNSSASTQGTAAMSACLLTPLPCALYSMRLCVAR